MEQEPDNLYRLWAVVVLVVSRENYESKRRLKTANQQKSRKQRESRKRPRLKSRADSTRERENTTRGQSGGRGSSQKENTHTDDQEGPWCSRLPTSKHGREPLLKTPIA